MKVPITKPFFDQSEQQAVSEVLTSGWVTQGPKVAEFERAVQQFVGAKAAVAISSATTGLFLSLYLHGIKKDDEVIVPSLSFIASANVVVHLGAKPVFVDINPQTYNLDPDKIEQAVTKKTKAIVVVDQVGLPANLLEIFKIAKKHRLVVIEDAACALGSKINNRMIGSMGDIAVFSFHPRKLITTGEGGMIVTNHPRWAEKLRVLRHHGMSVSDVVRHNAKKVIRERYKVVGFNFRMSDIQAAVGVEQMKKLPEILKKRQLLAQRYNQAFANHSVIIPPFVPPNSTHNYQSYIVRISPSAKVGRDQIMQQLLNQGISSKPGVMASHLEPIYQKMLGKISLPHTEAATKETLILPLFHQMTTEEQDLVIDRLLAMVN